VEWLHCVADGSGVPTPFLRIANEPWRGAAAHREAPRSASEPEPGGPENRRLDRAIHQGERDASEMVWTVGFCAPGPVRFGLGGFGSVAGALGAQGRSMRRGSSQPAFVVPVCGVGDTSEPDTCPSNGTGLASRVGTAPNG